MVGACIYKRIVNAPFCLPNLELPDTLSRLVVYPRYSCFTHFLFCFSRAQLYAC